MRGLLEAELVLLHKNDLRATRDRLAEYLFLPLQLIHEGLFLKPIEFVTLLGRERGRLGMQSFELAFSHDLSRVHRGPKGLHVDV